GDGEVLREEQQLRDILRQELLPDDGDTPAGGGAERTGGETGGRTRQGDVGEERQGQGGRAVTVPGAGRAGRDAVDDARAGRRAVAIRDRQGRTEEAAGEAGVPVGNPRRAAVALGMNRTRYVGRPRRRDGEAPR